MISNDPLDDFFQATLNPSSELMKNHGIHEPFPTAEQMFSVEDAQGIPYLLTVKRAGLDFHLTTPASAITGTGWQHIDLRQTELADKTIIVCGIDMDQNHQVKIVASTRDNTGRYSVFASEPTAIGSLVQASQGLGFWHEIILPTHLKATKLLVTVNNVIAAAGTEDHWDTNYYRSENNGPWAEHQVPNQTHAIQSMSLGTYSTIPGIFLLFKSGAQALIFQSFDGLVTHIYPISGQIDSIAAHYVASNNGTSYLYASGSAGIRLYINNSHNDIYSGTNQIKKIQVSSTPDGSNVAIWGVQVDNQNTNLLYLNNQAYDNTTHTVNPGTWTVPIVTKRRIANYCCSRGEGISNQMFAFTEDENKLSHLFQDPKTTLWKSSYLPIEKKNTPTVTEFNSYTTHLDFTFSHTIQKPINQFVMLSSSANLHVVANGANYFIGPKTTAKVYLDSQHNITLINRVDSLHAPTFYVEANFLSTQHKIDPTIGVSHSLGNIKSGNDLLSAKRQNGNPVYQGKKPTNSTANSFAKATQQLLQAKAHLDDNTQKVTDCWGLQFTEGGHLKFLEEDKAKQYVQNHTEVNDIFGLGHLFGDFLHWLEHVADDIGTLVVNIGNGIATFTFDAVSFIVHEAEQVFAVMKWLFNKIVMDIETIIEWLGALFDWNNIIDTHKVIKNVINQTFAYGENEMTSLQSSVEQLFDTMTANINKNLNQLPSHIATANIKSGSSQAESKGDSHMANPAARWHTYHLQHSGILSGNSFDVETKSINQDLLSFITGNASMLVQSFATQLNQIFKDFGLLFDHQLSFNDMVNKVTADMLGGFLDALKKLILSFFTLLKEAIGAFKGMLNTTINIPFLTPLYTLVVGSSPSLLDIFALLFSVPICFIYKVTTNKLLSDDLNAQGLKEIGYQSLFSQLKGEGAVLKKNSEFQTVYAGLGACVIPCVAVAKSVLDLTTMTGTSKPKFKFVASIIGIGASFPVCWNAKAKWGEIGLWAISMFSGGILGIVGLLGKSLQDEGSGDKDKILGAFGAVFAAINLGLFIDVLVEDGLDQQAAAEITTKALQDACFLTAQGCGSAAKIIGAEGDEGVTETLLAIEILGNMFGAELLVGRFAYTQPNFNQIF